MSRVERIGLATLYLGDCREIAPTLPRPAAVISDPPYGIAFAHGGGGGCLARSTQFAGEAIHGDSEPFDPAPWVAASDRVILWGANHYADRLPPMPSWLTWDKRDGIGSNDQADCEHAWSSTGRPARVFRHLWNGMLKASERGQPRVHPTQKPIPLMRWCIEQAKVPARGLILDPYMGSGSTGVAAVQMGHPFVGVEIDEQYFDTACRRIEAAQRQADLFVSAPMKRMPVDLYPVLPLGDAE